MRQILLKLSCEKDIEALGETHATLSRVAGENRVWRALAHYHFTPQQLQLLQDSLESLPTWPNHRVKKPLSSTSSTDSDSSQTPPPPPVAVWKLKFQTLKRRYGLGRRREEYAEELNLCKSCGLLFWPAASPTHDCGVPLLIPVKPGDFIKYFCV